MIVIIDFGSQYTMLIARKIRELGYYCEIIPCTEEKEEILNKNPKAVILSGSPFSIWKNDSPKIDLDFLTNIPVLAICYGMQLVTKHFGGEVSKSDKKEFGKAILEIKDDSDLFANIGNKSTVWMSHGDSVNKIPKNAQIIGYTSNTPNAAFRFRNFYCLQFHPEVSHSVDGLKILKNFITKIAHLSPNWDEEHFVETKLQELKSQLKDSKVLVALSGGVDSTVVAYLLHKAIGDNLHTMYIDTGLMRKNESNEIIEAFTKKFGSNFHAIESSELFISRLESVSDPETKRKIIGKTFIDVFEQEAKKLTEIDYLAQGTLYPDVIESISFKGPSVTIKSHHNVGGLPENLPFKLVEPLRELFKDEVRNIGRYLNVPNKFISRKPFPGPGLAIRILGEIKKEKLKILKEADYVLREIIKNNPNIDKSIWQLFAVLLPVKTVGVMGDERTYEYVCAIRAVSSIDGMTADWSRIPHDILAEISTRIINEVTGINRVVYDITSKPPSTIEWE